MKSSLRCRLFTSISSTTTVVYSYQNDKSVPVPDLKIPIKIVPEVEQSASTVKLSPEGKLAESMAAVKVQSAYRGYVVRVLVRKIAAVNSEANYWQRMIQRQETVDAVRASQPERIKINEALMGLLFKLDSVPGIDPNVRELRRHVSRRIVGLQEILDAVSDTKVQHWDGYLRDWDDIIIRIEKEACKDKGGGYEMEKFCAEHLGFQCLQRFLTDQ